MTPTVQHRPGCRQQAAGSIGTSRLVRSEAARSWLLTGGSSLETLVFLTCRICARNEKATGRRIFKLRSCHINLVHYLRTFPTVGLTFHAVISSAGYGPRLAPPACVSGYSPLRFWMSRRR